MSDLRTTEDALHKTMKTRDTARGAARGAFVGGVTGLLGGRRGAAIGTAVGAAAGGALGHAQGNERVLRDKVKEMRTDDRYERRRAAKIAAFHAELQKEAFMGGLAKTLGQRVIGMGTQAARGLGQSAGMKSLMQTAAASPLGGKNLARNVGYGVMGAGALGASSLMGGQR